MAKRSDFAQKLLDDLRLRKEQVASQSSSSSKPMATDAYAYSKQTHAGSRDIKTVQTIGSRRTNIHNRSSGSNRFSIIEEASKQIVPYARGQSSEPIGGLSMALAFAIENGRILRTDSSRNNPMLGFLQQIGRRSMDIGKMKRSSVDRQRSSSSHFPTLSHLHIEDISKGAQNLNQILRACSGGLNFDRYSIEIGKELLKGAMDLEESLRMLVNMQEASEYMISPQRKNRIVLLEDDEDNEDNTVRIAEQKQLDQPRFSFDKSSRHSPNIQEVGRNSLKQRLKALTYPTEATNYNLENQALILLKSVSHKQSASNGPDIKTLAAFSEQKNHSSSSQSKPEKERISNVIAKLMGLDDLPQQADTRYTRQKDSTHKQKTKVIPLQHTTRGSTKNAVLKTKDTTNLEPPKRQKVIEAKRNHVTQDATFVLEGGKNLPTRNASFKAIIPNGNPPQKDLEQIQPGTSSEKANIKNEKQQSKISQLNQNTGSQRNLQDKEREQDDIKHREQKGMGMGKTKEPISREGLRQMEAQAHKRSKAAVILQAKAGYKESMIQPESRYANKLLTNNQEKSQNSLGLKPPYILQKPEQQGEKNQGEEREKQSTNQKFEVSKKRGSGMIFKSSSKTLYDVMNLLKKHQNMNQAAPSKKGTTEAIHATQSEGFPNGRHHEDLAAEESSTNLNFHVKALVNRNSDKKNSPADLESEQGREKSCIPPVMEGKPVYVPAMQKTKNTKAHKSETPRKIDEVLTRRNGTLHNFMRPLKNQSSISQEVKPRRNEKLSDYKGVKQEQANRSKEAESHTVKSNKSSPGIQPLNVAELMKEAEQASPLHGPPEDRCQSLKEPILPPNRSNRNMVSTISNDQQDQAPVFGGDEELKGCKFTSNALTGTIGDSTNISFPSRLENWKIPILGMQEPLTESENCLKQILITSELFLNTAEALFEFNIPFDILHASGTHDYQDEESKLILDWGYDVMKRKGRRQELTVHPCANISIRSTKVKSLDDLIKQLHKDLENLKFYGRKGNPKADIENYLPNMLETDVHTSDPDVNCMWDLGWNNMFALLEKGDVIRDVEKHVLSGLVDEITRDLL